MVGTTTAFEVCRNVRRQKALGSPSTTQHAPDDTGERDITYVSWNVPARTISRLLCCKII
jgi:hypothetical protein